MKTRSNWRAFAGLLALVNLLGLGYAIAMSEPWHAAVHAVLLVIFGTVSGRARERTAATAPGTTTDRISALEDEVSMLQGELTDARDRLDFTERMLVHETEERRQRQER